MPPKKKVKTETAAAKRKKAAEEAKKKKQEEESEEETSDSEEEESTDDEDRGRGKRKRRESKGFVPFDFTMASEMKVEKAKKGRGVKLGSIAFLKEAIEKSGDDLPVAYTFVFGQRAPKGTKKEMKEKLLEFNGYLPAVTGNKTEKELDREEELVETKFCQRTFKLPVPQVTKLANFFCVEVRGEDGKTLHKDDMVENLLEFLSEPDKGLCVDPAELKKTKKAAPKKNKKKNVKKKTAAIRKAASKKAVEDPFAALKAHEKGTKPTAKVMRQWAKAYTVCFDLDSATTKHAINTASERFGVDMAPQKAKVKEYLADEL